MLLLASYVTQTIVTEGSAPAGFLVPLGAVAAFAWYMALRVAIQGVVADESGVLVRNGLRSHRLRWDEIERFEYGRCDPWPRVGVVVLQSGHRIAMVSLQRGYVGHFPERAVEALNGQLAQHATLAPRAPLAAA